MRDLHIPDLTFPMIQCGRQQTPLDLRILLYKGGAGCDYKKVFNRIAAGELGHPIAERIELVERIHETMLASLVGGGASASANTYFGSLRLFFRRADHTEQPLTVDSVEDTYFDWCEFLRYRVRLKKMKEATAYGYAAGVSGILSRALNRTRGLIQATRLRNPKRSQRAAGIASDKQNLSKTFEFGHLCLDVANSLPVDAVFGPLPVPIRLRDGRVMEQWSGLAPPTRLAVNQPGYKNKHLTERSFRRRDAWETDRTLRTRHPLVNIRIMAELLIFIGQTAMNLSQAHKLRRSQFSYKSTIDGYEVRDYKKRRQGEVLFEIFAEYKVHFESYLAWRDQVFAGETIDLLFPLIRQGGALDSTPPNFQTFRENICKPSGIPFVGPQALRKTRVNWLLRKSRDANLTAEQAQHTKQTLLRVYEKPSLQVAQIEITQFWKKADPRLGGSPMPCPGPGVCDGIPESMPDLPPEAPKPDCTHPAGCLFCTHHRDIDSRDYVWSAASMRHLHTIIIKRFRPVTKGKADAARHVELAIEILTEKLKWFKESNSKRRAWVDEAVEQMAESDFHPHWRYLIESAEGV